MKQVILASRKGPRREQATIVAAEAEEQMGTALFWSKCLRPYGRSKSMFVCKLLRRE